MEIGREKSPMFIDGPMTTQSQDKKRTLLLNIYHLKKEKRSFSTKYLLETDKNVFSFLVVF
jgi:hypothetical protein